MKRKQFYTGILLLVFVILNTDKVQGQQIWNRLKKHLAFAEEYDETIKFKLGIFLSTVSSNYVIEKSNDWYLQGIPTNATTGSTNNPDIGTFSSIAPNRGIALNLGIPLDYKLNDYFNLTLSPGFTFWSRHSLEFSGTGPIQKTERRHINDISNDNQNFNLFELPLTLKMHSEAKYMGQSQNSYKVYLLGGMKYSNNLGADSYYDIRKRSKFDPETTDLPIIVKPDYFSYEAGLGIDLYFPYFKMSPEIRFSQSLGNLLDKSHPNANLANWPNPFMNSIDKLSLRSLQFSLIFQ